jgi:sulfofructose kinase
MDIMNEIVGVGACVYDTLIVADTFPAEDTKIIAESVMQSGGGPCGTGLVAAAKLGAKCGYIGVLSDDAGGAFLLDDFKKYHVDTGNIKIFKGSSFSSYVLVNTSNAARTCIVCKGNLPALSLDANQKRAIETAKILMVDGNELSAAIEAAEAAKNSNTKILYDAGGLYEGIDKLLPYADILIPSEEFAIGFTGEKDADSAAKKLYSRFGPDVVVVTQGKEGGVCFDGSSLKKYSAFAVDVVDSNGAGDVFHGAFAFAQVMGFDYYKSCLFSSAASALKCTELGARAGAPDYGGVIAFLRRNGYEL